MHMSWIGRGLAVLQAGLAGALVTASFAQPVAAAGNPSSPAFAKVCQGPGPNGAVSPGQTDVCTIRLTAGSLPSGATVRINPTSPGGASATCSGPNAVQGAQGCQFKLVQGLDSSSSSSGLGSESLRIPATLHVGSTPVPVFQEAVVCDPTCGAPIPVGVTGLGAQVTAGGPSGCPPTGCGPPRVLPKPPYATKTCTGPNPNGTVSPGQTETCVVYAAGGASYKAGDQIEIARAFNSPVTVVACSGATGSYQTSGTPATTNNLCSYHVASGNLGNGQLIGMETISIPSTVAPGTPIQQVAIFCAAPQAGQVRNCSDTAYPIVVSGPGAVVMGNQTIDFAPLPPGTFGDASFTLLATASSGLPVTYTTTGPCTVNGSVVTITGGGVCTITANQAGNGSYNPAPPVSQSFTIDCFPAQLPFGVQGLGNAGTAVLGDLLLSDAHSGPGGACGGTFTVQVPFPSPIGPVTVATGTFTASTSGTVATGTLSGALLTNPPTPFTVGLTLDSATHQGNITETFMTEEGPVTITVSFVQDGTAYVVTGVTRT